MHYKAAKSILSTKNGMNLYRGCTHGCIYCDSRSTCYHMEHDFCDVEVKQNAIELLDAALYRRRKTAILGMGAMCDPYQPLEQKELLTRRALETALRHGFGITLITKSALVLRDIELLTRINAETKCVVQMTLTTFDERLCRIIEPNVSTTYERYLALRELRAAGVPTVAWLTPLLPFINDTEENLDGILRLLFDADVTGILFFGAGLTLREGNREYFYKMLDRHFPGMKQRYIAAFGDSYGCFSPHTRELTAQFKSACRAAGVMCDNNAVFKYLNTLPIRQASLFD